MQRITGSDLKGHGLQPGDCVDQGQGVVGHAQLKIILMGPDVKKVENHWSKV